MTIRARRALVFGWALAAGSLAVATMGPHASPVAAEGAPDPGSVARGAPFGAGSHGRPTRAGRAASPVEAVDEGGRSGAEPGTRAAPPVDRTTRPALQPEGAPPMRIALAARDRRVPVHARTRLLAAPPTGPPSLASV